MYAARERKRCVLVYYNSCRRLYLCSLFKSYRIVKIDRGYLVQILWCRSMCDGKIILLVSFENPYKGLLAELYNEAKSSLG